MEQLRCGSSESSGEQKHPKADVEMPPCSGRLIEFGGCGSLFVFVLRSHRWHLIGAWDVSNEGWELKAFAMERGSFALLVSVSFCQLLSLTLDGLTGVSQDHMRAHYQTGSNHMMLNVNLWSTLFLGAGKERPAQSAAPCASSAVFCSIKDLSWCIRCVAVGCSSSDARQRTLLHTQLNSPT